MKYVILAGGSGTRLWPLSRKNLAKQFICLTNQYSMLQNTALRVSKSNGQDIHVISNRASKMIINKQLQEVLPGFNDKHLIIEPEARNTAPAIAYGCLFFNEDDIVAILASDHYIGNSERFNHILNSAEDIAREDYLVTLGIIPDQPKTGYGYIKKTDQKIQTGYKVAQFVEKPDLQTAQKYLKERDYFWNAGIFIFKVGVFFNELRLSDPEFYQAISELKNKMLEKKEITESDYKKLKKISIDYALMEKSSNIVVIPADFQWSDVGDFKSLYDIVDQDEDQNVVRMDRKNYYNIDSNQLLIFGDKRKIATIGLKNMIIIDTPDALLISDNQKTEQVKQIAEKMQYNKEKAAIEHSLVSRSLAWGTEVYLEQSQNCKVKKMIIKPGKQLFFQFDLQHIKNWFIISGTARVVKGDEVSILKSSQSIFIPAAVKHEIKNQSRENDLIVIEIESESESRMQTNENGSS